MKRIHFIRHGKTERSSDTGRDFDRKLQQRGIDQSEAVGKDLFAAPETYVYCSTAVRTRETLNHIMKHCTLSSIKWLDELYLCNMRLFLELIWECTSESELLFVGHNFGISDVVSYLSGESIELRTGEYIVLEFDVESWEEISADQGNIIHRYRLPNP